MITIAAAVMIAVGRSRGAPAPLASSVSAAAGRRATRGRATMSSVPATAPVPARDGRARGTRQAPAPLRERFGEFGFLVDGFGLRERTEAVFVAAQIVAEIGFGPVGALGPESGCAPRDRRPGFEVVVDHVLAGVVGEDRGHRARGRLGPVRQRRNVAGTSAGTPPRRRRPGSPFVVGL